MKVTSLIYVAIVASLLDGMAADPLLGNETFARTFSQQNMKCNTRSAIKRVTLSHSIIYDSNSQNCGYTIRAFSTKVCQLRIDFLFFELEQPSTMRRPYAYCAGDRLSIDGLKFDLCGRLVNQHVTFDVQRLTDEVVLDFQIGSNSFAMWNIEINQIECGHKAALVTPDERQENFSSRWMSSIFCQTAGVVESFNFGYNYLGNTHYAICFNRNYNDNAILELFEITFDMDGNAAGAPIGFDAECLDPTSTPANNKKDYIAIPFAAVTDVTTQPTSVRYHSLFCLKSLDGKELEFRGTGPMVIHVNTDEITDPAPNNESGFRFRYRIRRQ